MSDQPSHKTLDLSSSSTTSSSSSTNSTAVVDSDQPPLTRNSSFSKLNAKVPEFVPMKPTQSPPPPPPSSLVIVPPPPPPSPMTHDVTPTTSSIRTLKGNCGSADTLSLHPLTETTMQDTAAAEAPPQEQQSPPSSAADALSEKLEKIKISSSFSIWPPTQRTRDAVTNRLIETLSTPSILSKRYGTVSPDEASVIAKSIEEEAFAFAAASAAAATAGATEDPIDGGIEILQVYSKEISKRVLDAVKSRIIPKHIQWQC
ncbi:hypothetical protein RND81_10G127600 [Saponaria officinalis]|uniref:WPP domain-containing protein n=1 Tax=Saponaria officinalis TaxID=3572 RepID=A0AAW1I1D1_SAPOF